MSRLIALSLIATLASAEPMAPTPGSYEIVDRSGIPLRIFLPRDQLLSRALPLESIAPAVVLATLAAEDRRFFSHSGVDLQATARALWQNAVNGRVISGGSTVTQQLVRLLDPHPRTLSAKVHEAWKALSLERRMSKHDILEAYLNSVSYGNGCKGIEMAAQVYFDEPSADLSFAQAALLAGIPQSPAGNEPVRHWDHAVARQQMVLNRLESWGWISLDEARLARAERVQLSERRHPWLAPHFTEEVRRRLQGEPTAPPAIVESTIDASLQDRFEKIMAGHLEQLQRYHVTNAAIVAIDNASGNVLAWVGSADYFQDANQGHVDGVLAHRQPGSALKPFIYALAFSHGLRPSDILRDEPFFERGYMPRNYDGTFHGPVRAREALACSYNIPAVRLGQQLGVETVLRTLHDFGLDSLTRSADDYGLGLMLGDGEVSLLELTNAYASLARGGLWIPTRLLSTDAMPPARRAMDRDSAYLVTDILSDNAARARAFGLNSPFHLSFPLAAKTGTTKDYKDNWAIGYTPDWTVGVWVGNFNGDPMRGVSGITGAAPILHDAALLVASRFGTRPFSAPAGVRELEVCPESGKLPGPHCRTLIRDVFSVAHLPTETCALSHNGSQPVSAAMPSTTELVLPVNGDIFEINPRIPLSAQALKLQARTPLGTTARWFVDEHALPKGSVWWTLVPGRHRVALYVDKNGRRLDERSAAFLVIQ